MKSRELGWKTLKRLKAFFRGVNMGNTDFVGSSLLSARTIYKMMHEPDLPNDKKVIITPVLDWSRQASAPDAAIDVRLGQRFVVPKRARIDRLDHLKEDHLQNLNLYKDVHHVLIGDHFVLHPRQFVLGETLEWIHLPLGYAAFVIGRSSWGRDGLIIATATGIHPGFSGILTLEITNVGEIPLYLYPGLTIAQLFVHTVLHQVEEEKVASSHTGDTKASNTDAAGLDKVVIKRIGKKRGIERWRKINGNSDE